MCTRFQAGRKTKPGDASKKTAGTRRRQPSEPGAEETVKAKVQGCRQVQERHRHRARRRRETFPPCAWPGARGAKRTAADVQLVPSTLPSAGGGRPPLLPAARERVVSYVSGRVVSRWRPHEASGACSARATSARPVDSPILPGWIGWRDPAQTQTNCAAWPR
jgi:hypothetical protein